MFATTKKLNPNYNHSSVDRSLTQFAKPILDQLDQTLSASPFSLPSSESSYQSGCNTKNLVQSIAPFSPKSSNPSPRAKFTSRGADRPSKNSFRDQDSPTTTVSSYSSSPVQYDRSATPTTPSLDISPHTSTNNLNHFKTSTSSTTIKRTGDWTSFSIKSDSTVLSKAESTRLYRVLCITSNPNDSNKSGKSSQLKLFDPIDGRSFSFSFSQRITHHMVLFTTKQAALSERFPHNQAGAGVGGNQRYPKILVAFGK